MTSAHEVLLQSMSVLVIDWPSRDAADSLARAGLSVIVRNAPLPRNFAVCEMSAGEIVVCRSKSPPSQVCRRSRTRQKKAA